MRPPKLRPSRSINRRVMACRIFSSNDRPPFWILKNNIWSRDIVARICCCIPNFIKIGSRVRPPDAHNCWMSNAPLLGNVRSIATASWGTCRGYGGVRPPKFHPNRSSGRRVIAFPTFCNMVAVRHLEYAFCYSGPPTKSTMRVDYLVKIWCRSDIPRRRYCDFIILPVWLENT